MTITSKKKNNSLIIAAEGRLDMESAPVFEKFLEENSDGIESFVFDFKKLEYISSAGLRVLLMLRKKAPEKEEFIVIKHANETVRSVFEVTGFSEMFDIK